MTGSTEDPYIYAGTEILRNLRDLRDPEELARFEADVTTRRLIELERNQVAGFFDTRHLREIHRYIFQDVYDWAGEFRTVEIAKPGQIYFALQRQIAPSLNATLANLQREQLLTGLAPETFVVRAAHNLGELNAIHPFRDGNGRAQREFVRQLALTSGNVLNWSRVNPRQVHEASRRSFYGDNAGLADVLRSALDHKGSNISE